MERMTKGNKVHLEGAKAYGPQDYEVVDEMKILEEENKKLRAYADNLDSENDNQAIEIEELKKENKKLNIKVASLEGEIKGLNSTIDKLKEENQTLELWLDRKEKVNKQLREENKKLKKERDLYKARNEELNENCFGLAKENENLKSDLSECECSFGFENDEVGFWKLEYKRLKKWIKDHCKGYGNLFPEDEMKRQWKKADKKRKKEEIRVSRDEHSYDDIFRDDELKKKTKLFEGEYKHIPKKL